MHELFRLQDARLSPKLERRGRRLRRAHTVVVLLVTYTVSLLWHERPRFLSAVLAVACSAALIHLQWGLVLGIYAATSIPIDRTDVHVWVGGSGITNVDAGRRISMAHLSRIAGMPEVRDVEPILIDHAPWVKPDGTKGTCIIIGSRLGPASLGAVRDLTPQLRACLAEPGAVVVDRADEDRLGIRETGQTAEVHGQRVRVAGWVDGLKGLHAPFVFCSLDTARRLLDAPTDQTTYFLVRCSDSDAGQNIAQQLDRYSELSAHTSEEFSRRTRWYWLFETPGGLATTCMASLTLLVGAVITGQALYAATTALMREYALLRALGVTRRRIATLVMAQSFGIGVGGVILSIPIVAGLGQIVEKVLEIHMVMPSRLWLVIQGVSVAMALAAGLATLRTLRHMEPMALLK
jgi:putative ABC transport system permease protein